MHYIQTIGHQGVEFALNRADDVYALYKRVASLVIRIFSGYQAEAQAANNYVLSSIVKSEGLEGKTAVVKIGDQVAFIEKGKVCDIKEKLDVSQKHYVRIYVADSSSSTGFTHQKVGHVAWSRFAGLAFTQKRLSSNEIEPEALATVWGPRAERLYKHVKPLLVTEQFIRIEGYDDIRNSDLSPFTIVSLVANAKTNMLRFSTYSKLFVKAAACQYTVKQSVFNFSSGLVGLSLVDDIQRFVQTSIATKEAGYTQDEIEKAYENSRRNPVATGLATPARGAFKAPAKEAYTPGSARAARSVGGATPRE